MVTWNNSMECYMIQWLGIVGCLNTEEYHNHLTLP